MADIAVLVAENEGALDALAAASALKIIAGTKRIHDVLPWTPRRADLHLMLKSAIAWERGLAA